jgi:tRNA/rRNA methyltransferase
MPEADRSCSVLDKVRIVLVRPQGTANVGAAARAMKNMGLRDLALVGTSQRRVGRASVMAVHARDVVERATRSVSLAAAVADCHVVIGTTCRDGLYRASARDVAETAPWIIEQAARSRIALVFGPEDHGLTNEDLKHCHRLIRIPTSDEYPSLNLAQAVLLCCYELRRVASGSAAAQADTAPATAKEVDFVFERLQEAFLRVGFLNPQNPDHIMFALRRLLGRAGLEPVDCRILLGLARQIEWYAGRGWEREMKAVADEVS